MSAEGLALPGRGRSEFRTVATRCTVGWHRSSSRPSGSEAPVGPLVHRTGKVRSGQVARRRRAGPRGARRRRSAAHAATTVSGTVTESGASVLRRAKIREPSKRRPRRRTAAESAPVTTPAVVEIVGGQRGQRLGFVLSGAHVLEPPERRAEDAAASELGPHLGLHRPEVLPDDEGALAAGLDGDDVEQFGGGEPDVGTTLGPAPGGSQNWRKRPITWSMRRPPAWTSTARTASRNGSKPAARSFQGT